MDIYIYIYISEKYFSMNSMNFFFFFSFLIKFQSVLQKCKKNIHTYKDELLVFITNENQVDAITCG